MLLEENRLLAPFTTLGIGGPARWFVKAASEEAIAEAAAWAGGHAQPLFVLGGGSNLLIADVGFDGLVVQVGLRGIARTEAQDQSGQVIYQAAAGEDWDGFVELAVADNCAGIECLAGIPGTVGGTPVQNVGAYGQEVASTIEQVRAYDLMEHRFVEFTAAECGFGYRRSRFNSTDRGRYVVTRVDYRLKPGGTPTLRYADLQRAFPAGSDVNLIEVAAAVRRVRQSKGMLLVEGDADCRSAGSFFKNPMATEEQVRQIAAAIGHEPPRFPAGPEPENAGRVKIPAAWLIEQAGFAKGYALGAAGVSSRHTLALINRGGATAAEILALAARIADAVETRFGIRLDMEPVMVGF
ncbi:MAG: UDP-N-acetylmuramate dehydrogenase [Acidobacteriota bacterium]|nr:UDP-N-acetylmuramate dehydrogenase [Acidobacteriota bacterium]